MSGALNKVLAIESSIESSSSSKRLTEDIAFLCSRIGVFARIFKTQNKKNNTNGRGELGNPGSNGGKKIGDSDR